ncbi:putative ATP synthase F1, epsilon subunit [Pseudoflavonifractor capillosus ATCC 29799]|uniref:Putative ATP synthase F1, epsilon subunit n=1 Tax=Pseudoflavonifractor capillosus ATCC 29799 TaxID=411467 RepID=A6P206_9FIRM|nr:DUF4230 domain-containing protein [Pseudoflavonifractor capillosus]EDM97676.1 putative ATP synthase F1, epsilon subunit [Pseudoflavonifractor capillosus ATCC 29799]
MEVESNQKNKRNIKVPVWTAAVAVIAIILVFVVGLPVIQQGKAEAEVITIATLQEIINVSELSTYTAVYNGIAQVVNEKNPEEIDYYVSYEAKVYAGIDFEEIEFSVDNDAKIIYVKLPEVEITKVDVDIASMDFIFYDNKANASTVSQTAYKACEADAQQESASQEAIYKLARQNACNVLTALINPIVEQMDAEFRLSIA